MHKNLGVTAAIASGCFISVGAYCLPSNAATFDLEYTFNDGTVFSGEIIADLDVDNNTLINITAVINPFFTGIENYSSDLTVIGPSSWNPTATVLTLDGSLVDFAAQDANNTSTANGIWLSSSIDDLGCAYFDFSCFPPDGALDIPFSLARYSLTPTHSGAIPEPFTIMGSLLAAGAGVALKRKQSAKEI